MTKFYVTHTDQHGERYQIGSTFEGQTPEHALYTLLEQAGAEDDGNYEVFAITQATAAQVREHYKAQGYEVRIAKDGRVTFRKDGTWREGRWVCEYRVDNGQVVLT